MRRIILSVCLFSAGGTILAQVGAPQMGWIPDRASIRPIYGIPAAAAVGARVLTHQDFSRIAVSPAGDYVLASATKTGAVSVYTPEAGLIPLEGAPSAPELIVLSPRGTAAVLWYASATSGRQQAQVVTGLPDAPAIRQVDASFLESAPDTLTLSDDGSWLAEASPNGVYTFGPNGEVNRLPLENVAALTFFQGTQDLAAASAAGVQRVTGVGGSAVVSSLLASADASLQPVGVATTSDNRALVLANRSGSVITVDIGTGAPTAFDCGCQPEGLFGMGPFAFRLTGLQSGSFKLFDAARGEILFAPLAQPAATDGAGQ